MFGQKTLLGKCNSAKRSLIVFRQDKLKARLTIGQIIIKLGHLQGWRFVVNANIKNTSDYLWFARSRTNETGAVFSGFDSLSGSGAILINLSQRNKMHFLNMPNELGKWFD